MAVELVGDSVISGVSVDLPGGRSVFIGHRPDDDSVFIQFMNKTTPTRLKLTPEAFDAMLKLHRGEIGKPMSILVPHVDVRHWHVVREETA